MEDPTRIQPEDEGNDDAVPEALRHELSRMYSPGEPIEVPPEIDRHITQMAHWRLSERVVASAGRSRGLSWAAADSPSKRRIFPMRLVTISAAAAALLLVVLITPRLMRTPAKTGGVAQAPTPPGTAIALRGDIDADGRVDIVDALLLSKLAGKDPAVTGRLRATHADLDVNGDGVVDQQDAISLRGMVVKLEGGAG